MVAKIPNKVKRRLLAKHKKRLKQMAIAAVVAVVMMFIIPLFAPSEIDNELNEIDRRAEISRAADDYMLAKNQSERQEAARNINTIKTGSRSVGVDHRAETIGFLLVIDYLIIVVLVWRILAVLYAMHKLGNPEPTRSA